MLVIECWNGPARLFPLYVRTGALLYTIHIIKKWSVTNVVITNVQWSNNKVMLAAWERRSPLYSLSLRLPYSRLTNLLFTKWHRRKLAGGAPSCRSRRRWIPLLPWTFFFFSFLFVFPHFYYHQRRHHHRMYTNECDGIFVAIKTAVINHMESFSLAVHRSRVGQSHALHSFVSIK